MKYKITRFVNNIFLVEVLILKWIVETISISFNTQIRSKQNKNQTKTKIHNASTKKAINCIENILIKKVRKQNKE